MPVTNRPLSVGATHPSQGLGDAGQRQDPPILTMRACRFAAKPRRVQVRLVRSYHFEAAHQLPNVPAGHKCAQVHGHSFGVDVVVQGPVDPTLGWCIDYGEIDAMWEPLYQAFDHHFLNEIPGLQNPTSENLARYIWDYFKQRLPGLVRVIVMETRDARCEYEGD